jgi:hypothetical protein
VKVQQGTNKDRMFKKPMILSGMKIEETRSRLNSFKMADHAWVSLEERDISTT